MCDAKSAIRTVMGALPIFASDSGTTIRFIAAYIDAPKAAPIDHQGARLKGGSRAIKKKSATATIMIAKCAAIPAAGAQEAVAAISPASPLATYLGTASILAPREAARDIAKMKSSVPARIAAANIFREAAIGPSMDSL